MAGRGPAPTGKGEGTRRRNAPDQVVALERDDALRGPDLPPDIDWPDATKAWWHIWRTSAQAKTFTATDWSFLLDTAILHMEFWDGDRSVAPELRLRAAKFGATPEDRARLKISIGDPAPKPQQRERKPATRTRKDRLLKAVGDDG